MVTWRHTSPLYDNDNSNGSNSDNDNDWIDPLLDFFRSLSWYYDAALSCFIFTTIIIRCSMMTTHGLEQCQVQSVSIYGYYLTGHVIYIKTCASLSECVILCSYEFRCKSFNFRLMDKLCELNDADRFTHPMDYVPMEGFLYKDTTEKHRKVSCHLAN